MRISSLVAVTMLAMTAVGCGGGDSTPAEAFELDGSWLYLGPWDSYHDLKIANGSMVYTDIDKQWSSSWTIKKYDNQLHHFQVTFQSGNGTYIPSGQDMSGSYVWAGANLTIQLANGSSYPDVTKPGSCTEDDSTLIPDCRLYMKQ
jgi:hypothetical protein